MNTILEQYNKIDSDDSEGLIGFYEENKIYFDNSVVKEDQDKISLFIKIKSEYLLAVYNKSNFTKAWECLIQVEQLLEKLDKNHITYKDSEQFVRYTRGLIMSHEGRHKAAHKIFKQLVKEYPDSFFCKFWYWSTKKLFYGNIFYIISVIAAAIILFGLLLLLCWFSICNYVNVDVELLYLGASLYFIGHIIGFAVEQYFNKKIKQIRKQKL